VKPVSLVSAGYARPYAGVPFVNYGQGYDDDDDISEVATTTGSV
jgi:hypothetical protein